MPSSSPLLSLRRTRLCDEPGELQPRTGLIVTNLTSSSRLLRAEERVPQIWPRSADHHTGPQLVNRRIVKASQKTALDHTFKDPRTSCTTGGNHKSSLFVPGCRTLHKSRHGRTEDQGRQDRHFRKRLALALAGSLAWGLVAAAPAAAATTDLRIQLNPALAELYAQDPAKAEQVLDALNQIIEGGTPENPPPATRSLDNPDYRSLLEGNPLLEEAWRIDPKAALDQLREIVAAGGGG